jgi:hypothetical protein
MCGYTYSYYCCSHDTFIHASSVELCQARLLSGYSYDAWTIDMCERLEVKCEGLSSYYCAECSLDYTLEYQLDEM